MPRVTRTGRRRGSFAWRRCARCSAGSSTPTISCGRNCTKLSSALTGYIGINNFVVSRQQPDDASEFKKYEHLRELHARWFPSARFPSRRRSICRCPSQAAAQRLWTNYLSKLDQQLEVNQFDITYFTAKHRDLETALDVELKAVATEGYGVLLKSA